MPTSSHFSLISPYFFLSLLISFVSSPKFVNSKIRNFHLFPLLIPVVNSRPYFQLFYSASTLTSPLLTSPRHHASYFCFVPLSDEKTVTFLPLTVLYLLITIPHLPSMTTYVSLLLHFAFVEILAVSFLTLIKVNIQNCYTYPNLLVFPFFLHSSFIILSQFLFVHFSLLPLP